MIRVAYVSQELDVHDRRFFASFAGQQDFEFHVVSIIPTLPGNLPSSPNIKFHNFYNRFFSHDDPFRREYPRLMKARILLGQYLYAYKLKRLCERYRIDLIHGGWVQSDGRVSALTGIRPFLLMPWGSDILINPSRNWWTEALTRRVIGKATFITCDCETVRARILKIAPRFPSQKFLVMPWGVDIKTFKPNPLGLSLRPMRLVMTRSLLPVYNVPFFIDVIGKLKNRLPELTVTIIGEGAERSKVEKRINELKLSTTIELLGSLPNERLVEHLQRSSLYISTSVSDGTSVSLLEAMACGLPCAVSQIPSNREWIVPGLNGILINPKNADETADQLFKLLTNPEKLVTFGEQCRKIAERRADWEKNVNKLFDLYRSLEKERQ